MSTGIRVLHAYNIQLLTYYILTHYIGIVAYGITML